MRTSARSNVVTRLTSTAFGVRSSAAAKPTAFPFCAVRLAMSFVRVGEEALRYLRLLLLDFPHLRGNFYRRQRRKQRLELGLQPFFVIFASFCLTFLVGAVHPNRLSEAHHRLPICNRVQP